MRRERSVSGTSYTIRSRGRNFQPSLILDFTSGQLPSGCTFTRASGASRFVDGVMDFVGSDVPRMSTSGILIEAQSTNYLRNNTMVGGVAGTIGSGASYPTNWGGYTSSTTGMVRTLSYGTENGLSYIDQRIYGTPSANYYQLFFETLTGIAGVQGNAFTASSYMRLSGGSTTNISHIKVGIQENNSSSSFLSSGTSGDLSLTSTFPTTPYAYARTLQSASTAYTRPFLQLEWTAGVSIDITLRIYQPQFEKASTYSSNIPTTETPATRAADLLTLDIPDGISSLIYTFDDDSTQQIAATVGAYTVPTNLNRPTIKRIMGVA